MSRVCIVHHQPYGKQFEFLMVSYGQIWSHLHKSLMVYSLGEKRHMITYCNDKVVPVWIEWSIVDTEYANIDLVSTAFPPVEFLHKGLIIWNWTRCWKRSRDVGYLKTMTLVACCSNDKNFFVDSKRSCIHLNCFKSITLLVIWG